MKVIRESCMNVAVGRVIGTLTTTTVSPRPNNLQSRFTDPHIRTVRARHRDITAAGAPSIPEVVIPYNAARVACSPVQIRE